MLSTINHKWQDFSREQQDTLFLLLVIAIVSLPHAQHLPYWTVALTCVVLLYRAYLSLTLKPLPSRWLLLTLLLVCTGATFLTFRTIAGRDAGVTLIMLLLALKTLELKAKRDAFVVFFLGFFAVLTHFLFSQTLLTAFLMLAAVTGLFTALVGAHMPVGKPTMRRRFGLAGKMMLLGTPLAMALFLFFPRLSAPLWGVPGNQLETRTGLSDQMSVGDLAEIALNDEIVFRLEFAGTPPQPELLYFRGPVLSSFDGRKWTPLRTELETFAQLRREERVKGAPITHTITLEPQRRPWLFALEHPVDGVRLEGYRPLLLANMQIFTTKPVAERVKYTVTSYPGTEHGPLQQSLSLQSYVDLPPGFNPRAMQYAADIRRDPRYANAGGRELAQLLLSQINSSYTYTLAPGLYGANSVDEFWFDRKQGFCEHFSQAFVVFMRAFDVPARVVTGYQGAEFNAFDNTYIVRQSHAHAWAEYWVEGSGWVRADPTAAVAPERIRTLGRTLGAQRGFLGIDALSNANVAWLGRLRSSWDAVNNTWNQWVLSYTSDQQLNLLKNMGFEAPDWASLAVIMIIGASLATALAGAWLVWDAPRRDPWQRLFSRAQAALRKQGVQSSPSDGARALATRLANQANFANAHAWRDWLLALEALRYSPASAAANPTGRRFARADARYSTLAAQLTELTKN